MRRFLTTLWLLLAPLAAQAVEVTLATDLRADAALARERGVPILLVFHAEHCHYCDLLDEEHLKPMVLSGNYTDKVVLRKVEVDGGSSLIDFDGSQLKTARFTARYGISMTPTMLFVDADGKELIPRIRGITGAIDYFGVELDRAIAEAGAALHRQHP